MKTPPISIKSLQEILIGDKLLKRHRRSLEPLRVRTTVSKNDFSYVCQRKERKNRKLRGMEGLTLLI